MELNLTGLLILIKYSQLLYNYNNEKLKYKFKYYLLVILNFKQFVSFNIVRTLGQLISESESRVNWRQGSEGR